MAHFETFPDREINPPNERKKTFVEIELEGQIEEYEGLRGACVWDENWSRVRACDRVLNYLKAKLEEEING